MVETGLENRVISISLEQLSKVSRAIGVAGGSRKYTAILGALRGHWINILVTDSFHCQPASNRVSEVCIHIEDCGSSETILRMQPQSVEYKL